MPGKIVLKMRQSLDGFVCSPAGDDSFLFAHIDDEAFAWECEHLWRAGVHVMGRNLYDIMAAYWPTSNDLAAAPMNQIPKAVFSKTLQEATWGPVNILRGSPAEEIAALKKQHDKDILVHGGASLAQALIAQNLIDEYRLLIHPVALGSGKPCFAIATELSLLGAHRFNSGVVALTYTRANAE
jgi:dihydrofolate reductase